MNTDRYLSLKYREPGKSAKWVVYDTLQNRRSGYLFVFEKNAVGMARRLNEGGLIRPEVLGWSREIQYIERPLTDWQDQFIRNTLTVSQGGEQPDPVNSPKHYQLANGVEVIDVIEAVVSTYDDPQDAVLMGNVIKYVLRAGNKDDFKQDLSKARWYLDRLIKKLETG